MGYTKDAHAGQRLYNAVFEIVRAAGRPITRSMAHENATNLERRPGGAKVTARIVTNGSADPDRLTTSADNTASSIIAYVVSHTRLDATRPFTRL